MYGAPIPLWDIFFGDDDEDETSAAWSGWVQEEVDRYERVSTWQPTPEPFRTTPGYMWDPLFERSLAEEASDWWKDQEIDPTRLAAATAFGAVMPWAIAGVAIVFGLKVWKEL